MRVDESPGYLDCTVVSEIAKVNRNMYFDELSIEKIYETPKMLYKYLNIIVSCSAKLKLKIQPLLK